MAAYIGQYEIVRELGSGAYGTVYLAEGEVPGKGVSGPRRRTVAVKKLRDPGDRAALETLQREFELLDLVKHRSMTRVYEFLKAESAVVMEYVDGSSLRDVIDACARRREAVFTEAAIEIGCEMADCLYQAYTTPGKSGEPLQIVHRDLKPENIMLTPNGEVKILDFGLAKVNARHRKDDANIKGTPLYMAPEQAQGKLTDHRTDLFALGLVLYELMLGKAAYTVPMEGKDPVADVMRRIERAELRDQMRELESHLPDAGPVVNRLLQANPRARYESGHELMLDLRRHLLKERGTYLREFAEYYFTNIRPAETQRAARGGADAMQKPPSPPRPGPPGAPPGPPRPGAPAGAAPGPRPGPPGAPPGPPRPSGPGASGSAPAAPRPSGPGASGSSPRPGGPAGPPPGPPGLGTSGSAPARPAGPPPRAPGGAPPPPPGRTPGPSALAKPNGAPGLPANGPSRATPGIPGSGPKAASTPALPPKPGKPESAKKPEEMLQMQNVGDEEEEEDQPVQSATQFFAIPTPKKGLKKPEAAPALGGPPKPENTAGRALPGAGQPLLQGGMGAQGSVTPGILAIQGPVAGNPNAGQAAGGQGAGFSVVGPNPVGEPPPDVENRGSSWKIFAIILLLLGMFGGAVTLALIIIVVGMNMGGGEAKPAEEGDDKADVREETPTGEDVPVERELEHKAAPTPKKPSKPVASGDKPAPEPKAPKKATDTLKVSGVDAEYNKVQVQCDGYNKTVPLTDGAASLPDVPTSGVCKAIFKGPTIAVASGVNGGHSYKCSASGGAASCK